MAQYKLKPNQPDFEVVDGPMAGRKFVAGQTYTEIPPQEKNKFEKIDSENLEGRGVEVRLVIPKSEIRNPKSKGEVKTDA